MSDPFQTHETDESMSLSCVSRLKPPLTRGRSEVELLLSGAKTEESHEKLFDWLDAIARELLPPCAFVYDLQG